MTVLVVDDGESALESDTMRGKVLLKLSGLVVQSSRIGDRFCFDVRITRSVLSQLKHYAI